MLAHRRSLFGAHEAGGRCELQVGGVFAEHQGKGFGTDVSFRFLHLRRVGVEIEPAVSGGGEFRRHRGGELSGLFAALGRGEGAVEELRAGDDQEVFRVGDDVRVLGIVLRFLAGKFLDKGASFPGQMLADCLQREVVALAERVDARWHELTPDQHNAGGALLGDLAVGSRVDRDDELMQVVFRVYAELFAEFAGSLQVLRLHVRELLESLPELGRAESLDVEADDGDGPGGEAVGIQGGLGRT